MATDWPAEEADIDAVQHHHAALHRVAHRHRRQRQTFGVAIDRGAAPRQPAQPGRRPEIELGDLGREREGDRARIADRGDGADEQGAGRGILRQHPSAGAEAGIGVVELDHGAGAEPFGADGRRGRVGCPADIEGGERGIVPIGEVGDIRLFSYAAAGGWRRGGRGAEGGGKRVPGRRIMAEYRRLLAEGGSPRHRWSAPPPHRRSRPPSPKPATSSCSG